jgi:hypothetical protein
MGKRLLERTKCPECGADIETIAQVEVEAAPAPPAAPAGPGPHNIPLGMQLEDKTDAHGHAVKLLKPIPVPPAEAPAAAKT